jgi:ATP-dependent Clp protease ATP-binding subunit ClpA
LGGILRDVFEKFTERARQVIVLAQEEGRTLKHNYIGTEHLLLGLLRVEEGLAARVLESLDITLLRARDQVVRIVGSGDEATAGQIPFTPRAKKVLELALREALSLGHNYIGTEHILLGLIREHEGVSARILLDLGANAETIRNEVIRTLADPSVVREQARSTMTSARPSPQILDQAWFGGLGAILDELAAEIRLEHHRAPDTGDLLLAFASASDTLVAQALRELGIDLDRLSGVVDRLRAQALARDELAREIQILTEAKEQAIERVTQLRAQERDLREQAQARAALQPEAIQEIRLQLGIPGRSDAPQPPGPSGGGRDVERLESDRVEGLTDRGRRVVSIANHEAHQICWPHIGSEHLLLGMLGEEHNLAARALSAVGVDMEAVRREMFRHITVVDGASPTDDQIALPFTPAAAKVVQRARRQASRRGEALIGPEHFLLAIIDNETGLARRILSELKVDLEELTNRIEELR